MEEFSVVVTTKDRKDYLHRLMGSIASNSTLPSEVVIVNDGGKNLDEKDFNNYGLPVKLINNERSRGANFSRNLGVRETKTEIVFLIDDDDAFTVSSFQLRLAKINSDPEIGLCFTGAQVVSDEDLSSVLRRITPVTYENYQLALFKHGNVIGSTSRVAIRKSIFNEAGGFDESLDCLQDYDLWIRISSIAKIAHDGREGVFYTVHAGNEPSSQISKKYMSYFNSGQYLYKKYRASIDQLGCSRRFMANVCLRVSANSATINTRDRCVFAVKSILYYPSLYALALAVLPLTVLRIFRREF
jgi:glycosyltransferase involved in cell wall biosynthesis